MRGLLELTVAELKLFLREPLAVFFTLMLPSLMLFLFGSIYGNRPSSFFGGFGMADISVPAYTAIIIASSGLLSISVVLSSYRENGVLRRFRSTPLRPAALLMAHLIVVYLMTATGMIFLIVAGKIAYGLRCDGNPIILFAAFTISSLSFSAIGFILASVTPTARTAQVAGMILFYPMIFLSGATIPRETFPEHLRYYSRLIPLTHVVTLLRGLWVGDSWHDHLSEVAVLTILALAGIVVSGKAFKWE